ncbi:PREDICTED: uncharacterized protein LOC107328482 [Acropora digitifera]|uniref:uncharacterized protein LOC107328482 n=1 Tax=Acropora digitifera TaxID=70779 RepID=UPI00077ABED4|nr:PREDICTED: uncharacterized protein LOC107328482 [Acropora digitifera]
MRPNKAETAVQWCKTVFVSLAAIDSVNNLGVLEFVRGCCEGVFEGIRTESKARVRGHFVPRYVEVVTRSPVSDNSMTVYVEKRTGRVHLSIALICPEDRTPCYPKSGECSQLRGQMW